MTKNSFRPGRGAQGEMSAGDGASVGSGRLDAGAGPGTNPLAGLGAQNLMGLPAQGGGGGMSMPPARDGGPVMAGGGSSGVMTANEPPLSAPPPSLTGGSPQDQVNAAYGAPQFDVNSMGVPGLEGLAGGGVLKAKGVPQIPGV